MKENTNLGTIISGVESNDIYNEQTYLNKTPTRLSQLKRSISLNDVKKNFTNIEVKNIQTALKKQGYILKVDGDFGNITRKHIKDVQRFNDMEVTGYPNEETLSLLGIPSSGLNTDLGESRYNFHDTQDNFIQKEIINGKETGDSDYQIGLNLYNYKGNQVKESLDSIYNEQIMDTNFIKNLSNLRNINEIDNFFGTSKHTFEKGRIYMNTEEKDGIVKDIASNYELTMITFIKNLQKETDGGRLTMDEIIGSYGKTVKEVRSKINIQNSKNIINATHKYKKIVNNKNNYKENKYMNDNEPSIYL